IKVKDILGREFIVEYFSIEKLKEDIVGQPNTFVDGIVTSGGAPGLVRLGTIIPESCQAVPEEQGSKMSFTAVRNFA
ncbi:MAG: hypothetical protein V1692_02185, partial [bacterium]